MLETISKGAKGEKDMVDDELSWSTPRSEDKAKEEEGWRHRAVRMNMSYGNLPMSTCRSKTRYPLFRGLL